MEMRKDCRRRAGRSGATEKVSVTSVLMEIMQMETCPWARAMMLWERQSLSINTAATQIENPKKKGSSRVTRERSRECSRP